MSLSSLFCQQKKNNRHLASQENKLSHFIQVIRKNLTQRKLSGILANTDSVELGSFQGIGFQTHLIVFTSLVMSDLLFLWGFLICWKRTWCTYHLSQALESSFSYSHFTIAVGSKVTRDTSFKDITTNIFTLIFVKLVSLSVSFPSPPTSSLWVKDNVCYSIYFSVSDLSCFCLVLRD